MDLDKTRSGSGEEVWVHDDKTLVNCFSTQEEDRKMLHEIFIKRHKRAEKQVEIKAKFASRWGVAQKAINFHFYLSQSKENGKNCLAIKDVVRAFRLIVLREIYSILFAS